MRRGMINRTAGEGRRGAALNGEDAVVVALSGVEVFIEAPGALRMYALTQESIIEKDMATGEIAAYEYPESLRDLPTPYDKTPPKLGRRIGRAVVKSGKGQSTD